MGQMSDGGPLCTKPYIGGSNYILKNGTFKRGPWVRDLGWPPTGALLKPPPHLLRANPALSIMVKPCRQDWTQSASWLKRLR